MDGQEKGPRAQTGFRSPTCRLGLAGLALGAGVALHGRRSAAREASRLAGTDPLTGGWNLRRFQTEVEKTLEKAQGGDVAVMVVDISRFKNFNDAFGYAEGDRLILELDQLSKSYEGEGEFHAHIGADQFVALLRWRGLEDFAARFARLDTDVNGLEMLKSRNCRILCYGGVAVFDGPSGCGRHSAIELIDRARYARECVRESPRSTFALYAQSIKDSDIARRALQGAAVNALANGEFVPYYQPKVALGTGEIVGFEALARWQVSEGEVIGPAGFVEPLESNGFMPEVDFCILRQACAFLRDRIAAGLPVVPMACNFSRLNLLDDAFVSTLLSTVLEYGVPCELLELELTESIAMEDLLRVAAVAEGFKKNGFSLAIDDFGSGYSSLGMLQALPVDVLKIDRSLLVSSQGDSRSRIILESVVTMADRLGVSVVVEGVETLEQAALLQALDPRIVVQGYLCSPAVPRAEAAALLDGGRLFSLL